MAKKLPKYTIAEYKEYLDTEMWKRNGNISEESYQAETVQMVSDWVSSSKKKFGKVYRNWKYSFEAVEENEDDSTDALTQIIGRSSLPLLQSEVLDQVANLFANYPRPIYIANQESENAFVGMLSTLSSATFEDNNISTLMFDLGYDLYNCNFGVIKQWIDFNKKGVFDKGDRITFTKCDPLCCYLDPRAKRLRWEDMNFFVYDEFIELGDLRRQYPDKGFEVTKGDSDGSKNERYEDEMHGEYFRSPVQDPTEGVDPSESRIRKREAWCKDSRLKFVADETINANTPGTDDYDPELPSPHSTYETDENGYCIGDWVPAYPDGRFIVTAGNHVLADGPNPFTHDVAPYTFFKLKPSKQLITKGFVAGLNVITSRENVLVDDIYTMARKEVKRPMVAESRTFGRNQVMSNDPDAIMNKSTGDAFFERLPPVEIPQFVWQLFGLFDSLKDKLKGTAAVNRGQLAEGSQLSSQAVQQLQDAGNTMPKMQAEYVAEGMKEFGRQLMHNLMMNYADEDLTCSFALPNGEKLTLRWSENNELHDEDGNKQGNPSVNYMVKIESGSGVPGAEAQKASLAFKLHGVKAVDDQFLLQANKIGDWQSILQRVSQKQSTEIHDQAAGKQVGLTLKKFEKANESPGRREGGT